MTRRAFRLCTFVAPKAARDGVFSQLAFPAAPQLPFLSHIFRWLEATQERRGRLVKAAFFAPRQRAERSTEP
jgi:hypothetical protein